MGRAPALLMGLGGLLLVGFGSPVHQVLNWVWPPVMLALAIWMIVRVSTASEPGRTLAAVPSDRGAGSRLDRRRLPDPGRSSRCQGIPDAWSIDRRGRSPPAPELHRLRQPHRRARSGRRGDVVESRVDRAGRSPRHPRLRLRPRRPRVERVRSPPRTARRSRPTCTRCCSAHTFRDPTCWRAIPSAASMCTPSPLATPTRWPAWCWWTPPRRRRRRHQGHHRLATGAPRRHEPCLGAGFGRSSTGSGPPVRPGRLRQPAAAVPGRGPRQRRDPKHASQHDRRVSPGDGLDRASGRPS